MPSVLVQDETISFGYTIIASYDMEVTLISGFDCPKSVEFPIEYESIELSAGVPFNGTYDGPIIKNFENQNCVAFVEIIDPLYKKVENPFIVESTPSFDFRILACKDENCIESSKIFLKSRDIYLNYDSDASNPTVSATLTLPNKNIQQLTLPTSINANQVGTYVLMATASKEGYKTTTKSIQFGVIAKEADIKTTGEVSAVPWGGVWQIGSTQTIYILIGVFILGVISVVAFALRSKISDMSGSF